MTRAAAAIDALAKRNPDAFRLAQAVSFAVVVDRALLRAARIEFVPHADAGVESDLWFSSVVKSRTVDGIVLDRDVADDLRRRMSAQQIERAWSLTKKQHEWLPPSLRIEEEIAYLSVSSEPDARDQLVQRIQSVVRAMLRGDRPGLAQWASRALTMFPTSVRELPESRMLDAGARLRLGQGVPSTDDELLPEWMPIIAPSSMPVAEVLVELRERELILTTAKGERGQKITVPDTKPIVLEVSWPDDGKTRGRQVVLRAGESVRFDVGSESVLIRTVTGATYRVREPDASSSSLRNDVIDFSAVLARHPRVIGRESELAALMKAQRSMHIEGDRGVGKTALLCEFIRRAGSTTPVVMHFFDSGEYRRGSITYATRSLAAQIVLRFRLDESVAELPLRDVFARLELSPRCPSRLFLVLDALGEGRDEEWNPLGDRYPMFLPAVPPFVTVIAAGTATFPDEERLWLAPHMNLVAELYDSEIAEQSQGNFARAEAIVAMRSLGERVFDDSDLRTDLGALIAARGPLPAELFGNLEPLLPLLRREDDRVSLVNDEVQELLGEQFPDEPYNHQVLLERLGRNRARQDVRAYYALHAVEHRLTAGEFVDARSLVLHPAFMREVIELHDPQLLRAHLTRLLEIGPSFDPLLAGARTAIDREHAAMQERPEEIESILHAYLPARTLPETISRLEAMDEPHPTDALPPRRHSSSVSGCIETSNGPVSWGADGRVMLWKRRGEAPPLTYEHATAVTAVAEVGDDLVFGDDAGVLYAMHRNAKVFASVAAHTDGILGVAHAIGTNVVATWSTDGVIRLWAVVRHEGPIDAVGELVGHEDAIVACEFVGGSRLLVSASHDGTIRTWSIAEQRAIQVVRNGSPVTAMIVASDGRWFCSGDLAGNLRLGAIEPQHEKSLATGVFPTPHRGGITGIAKASSDYLAAVWGPLETGVTVWRLPFPSESQQQPTQSWHFESPASVLTAAILRGGLQAFVSWADGTATLFDIEGGEKQFLDTGGAAPLCVVDLPQTFITSDYNGGLKEWIWPRAVPIDYAKHTGRIDAIAAGEAVLLSDGSNEVWFRDSEERIKILNPAIATNGNSAVAWSRTDGTAFVAALDRNGLIAIPSRAQLCAVERSTPRIAVVTYDGTIEIVRGSVLGRIRPNSITALAFTRNGLLISASHDGLAMWDQSGFRRQQANVATDVPVVHIEADVSGRVATISADGVLSLRTVESLQVIRTIDEDIDPHLGCRFAGNDTLLVAIGRDHTLRIIDDVPRTRMVGRGHRGPITGFVIDEGAVYTCSEDRTVRMWDLLTAEPLGVMYGPNAFRCITMQRENILAGNDGGEVLTFHRATDVGTWAVLYSGDDEVFANKLARDLQIRGVRVLRQFDRTADAILVWSETANHSKRMLDELNAVLSARKRLLVLVVDDTDRFESQLSYAMERIDFRRWSDPYRYDAALRQVIEWIKRGDRTTA